MKKEIRDEFGNISHIETDLSGTEILADPGLNKDSAFTEQERLDFKIEARLPFAKETLQEQVKRCYKQYLEKNSPLQKNIYLHRLCRLNQTLFYRLATDYLEEMLPIVYTPTIGESVERYSYETRRPLGLFLSYPERDKISEMLEQRLTDEVDIIVVTDGEGVLGIGDQGVGGVDIAVGKLMVYTLCAGINPNRVLPIVLDVGTNNHSLLNDPYYMGWRHSRVTGEAYDKFIEQFVEQIRTKLPTTYLHWEDFGRDNARRILEKYRSQFATFNDDMQGTGMVATANVLAASQVMAKDVKEHTVVMYGAGTAGVGIVDQICQAMVQAGADPEQARKQFYLIDRAGLLVDDMPDLVDFQLPYVRSRTELADWQIEDPNKGISLEEVVINVKPSIIIGCSTVFGAFNETIVKTMAQAHQHPIIMPLSNPNSHCEADPNDLMKWTEGRAMIACGSPYPPVEYQGKTYRIAQGNNAFVYPGLGLGVIASKAKRVTDAMLNAACLALSECSPIRKDKTAPLLPSFSDVHQVSLHVAKAVVKQAIKEGVAGISADSDIDTLLKINSWQPEYYPIKRSKS